MSAAAKVSVERFSSGAMVCTVDHLASVAGIRTLDLGGNAVDAAIAASATLAVTTQQMCGMGGDLWSLVHVPGQEVPLTLNASGRAGSGASSKQLRDEGHTTMPFRQDLRSATLPGCVDGWLSLHERLGRLPLAEVLAPGIRHARNGFPASPLLSDALSAIEESPGAEDYFPNGEPVTSGQLVRREGIARSLEAIVRGGRSAWYEGEFGLALQQAIPGQFSDADLAQSQADWVAAISVPVWDHTLWTVPPSSQGYLALASARIANELPLPKDPSDPLWAHFMIEASKQAGYDRTDVLFEGADGAELISRERLAPRWEAIDPDRASELPAPVAGGGTIYLCVTDSDGMGVSLIQSNAAGFGTNIGLPGLGVFIHNRGIGFSLAAGHPAELTPGRRPPSTLLPALITNRDGTLRSVLGTMGGDGQPQVVLQMAARLLQAGQRPGQILQAPRFTLTVPAAAGFNTWHDPRQIAVALEPGSGWNQGLEQRKHRVETRDWGLGMFGHAHMIDVRSDHVAGAADPRARIGAALGL